MRADDFRERNPDMEPPDYYMNYGDKYARRFTEELSPNLSERGQQWLVDARANLQEAMEARRAEDPAAFAELERDPEAFRRFAYDTHPGAYRDAGLAELRPSDLVQIPLTPDRQDLVSGPGLRQVVDTGIGVMGDWRTPSPIAVWGEPSPTGPTTSLILRSVRPWAMEPSGSPIPRLVKRWETPAKPSPTVPSGWPSLR